jgi:signal transduction histidine kinase
MEKAPFTKKVAATAPVETPMATLRARPLGPPVILRITRRLLPILMGVVVVAYVGSFARLALSLGELFPGVTLQWRKELKMLTIGPTPALWPGIGAGLQTNDRVLCIGGYRPNPNSLVYGLDPRYAQIVCPNGLKENTTLYRELYDAGQHTVDFDIDRAGVFVTIPAVPLAPFAVHQLFDLLLAPLLLSAGFLAIGIVVFRANPGVEVNLVFARWATISAAFLAMDAYSPAIGERLRSTPWAVLPLMVPWIPLWGVSLFHMAALWSRNSRLQHFSRRTLPFYYGLSIVVSVMGIIAYLFSETPLGRALDWPYLLFVAGSAVWALMWSIGLLIWSFGQAADRRDRWQYGLLLGAMLVLVPALILPRLALFFTAAAIPAFLYGLSYVALLSVVVMAYAIVRFQVMPVRTRGLEYLALFVFCILMATVVGVIVGNGAVFELALSVSLLTGFGLHLGSRLPFLTRVLRREQFDYAALVALEEQISAMQPIDELVKALSVILRKYLDVDGLSVWLLTGDNDQMTCLQPNGTCGTVAVTPALVAAAAAQVQPVTQAQPEADHFRALLAPVARPEVAVWASLTDRGALLGVLGLGPRWTGTGYDQRDLELIGALARQVALAIANTRHLERLATASRQLQEAQERERLKIAREIHDTILQFLLVLTYGLDDTRERHPEVAVELEGWQDRISQQAAELRSLLAYLRAPELLVQHGLVGALQAWLAQVRLMTPVVIAADLDDGVEALLSTEAKVAIYRVCREAVNNALKHGNARLVELRLWRTVSGVHFGVHDDGMGFDLQAVNAAGDKGYSSLQDMRVQMESVDGRLEILSVVGVGTEICGTVA